ncbi:MAG: hypothetical protein P1U37_07430 [Minwuia sp.]|nr:hypothetical protein [Minwuia sp.]
MSMSGVFLAIMASFAALVWRASTDPKRRRVFDLPPTARRHRPRLALVAFVVPGILLVATGAWAGLVVWMAALTVLGWRLAAISPIWLTRTADALRTSTARLAAGAAAFVSRLRTTLARLTGEGDVADAETARRLAALEDRVAALEARASGPAVPVSTDKSSQRVDVEVIPTPASRLA